MQKEGNVNMGKPTGNIFHSFHIEGDGAGNKMSISISSVMAVVELDEELISLRLLRGKINVRGKKLSISVYENNIVEIVGKVGNIEFL